MIFQEVPVKGVSFPKTRLGKAKMDKICEAAIELFSKQNFYQTSINDICEKAKIAVGTFYIYFADKSSLYNYLVQNYKLDILRHLREEIAATESETRRAKERAGIGAFIKYVYQNPQAYSIIWGSLSVDPKAFTEYYTSFAQTYAAGLSKDSDQLKSDQELLTLAYILMGITNFLGLKIIFEGNLSEEKLNKTMDYVMSVLENGVLKSE